MAQFNGKTPEQIAAGIVEAATKSTMVEISGVATQNLETILRYKFSKKIYSKGEKWFTQQLESLQSEFIEDFIESQYKSRLKADAKAEQSDKLDYANMLQSRGYSKLEAFKQAGLIVDADVEKPVEVKKPVQAVPQVETVKR